ncbi:MAG: hypothetical protein OXT09_36545 [Myxococcales bacterium]|nr:hypothetical protein [Myxococcales bacterium]
MAPTLLGLQALSIGAFCGLCVGADAAALLAAAAALPQLRKRAPDGPVGTPLTRAATRAALVLALGAPIALALSIPRAVPGYVRELGQADKLNVIEFSDFECPYCRALHPHLKQALERAARGQATAFGWRPWLVLLCAVLLAAVPALALREPQAA